MAPYDLAVIGGGVNGTGAFRDAVLRGLRCVLIEQTDFGAGATGASSGMIHGGVRYLLDQPRVTKLSCEDSGRIQRIVPHLLFRIPFLFVVPRKRFAGGLLLGLDGFFEAYDRYQPRKRGLPHERLTAEEALRVEPGLAPDVAGAVTFDEWGIDSHRLCWLNARSGIEAGGECATHVRVEALERGGGDDPVWVVRGRGTLDGVAWRAEARAVLNAAGAWGPGVAGLGGGRYRLRPSKGIHLVFDRRISNWSITFSAIDGRSCFLEPWQNVTILGTTDDDYYGDLDDIPVSQDEVEYLLSSAETVYPSIRSFRRIDTWAGIRPTLYRYGPNEDDLSREHRVYDHGVLDGRPGLFSLAGGKLASFRAMAEDAIDAVAAFLGRSGARCRTAELPLPGGEGPADEERLAAEYRLPRPAVRRLAYRHGALAEEVLAPASERPAWRRALCRCEPVTEVEVRHAVRVERAVTLADVMRRTRLGAGPCGGLRCALPAALVLAEELGRDAGWARAEARRFLEERYRSRRAVVDGAQFRYEALVASAVRGL